MPDAAVFQLYLTPYRVAQCLKTPLQPDIWPFFQHIIPKIGRHRLHGFDAAGKPVSRQAKAGPAFCE
jgi:hypothetical protein